MHGGIVVRIDRDGASSTTGASHSSDALAFEPDFVVRNVGSETRFAEGLTDAIADYAWS
ncbi:hypothetical protein [Labrys sp. KNU-23]|uniref:hypothetical protein n=1 Tax=Labrys sp. KNU-23 TaxID=2789216 RepID=UPI00165A7366|nr:hypothetical protein [Labrys sp. KNU-23]